MTCCPQKSKSVIPTPWKKGVVGVTKSVLGVSKASDEDIAHRRDVCRHCEEATRNPDVRFAATNGLTNWSRCKVCKCFVVAKTKVATETCPLDKW